MSDVEHARRAVEEAIDALTLEGSRIDMDGTETKLDPIGCNIAVELERIDSALGPRGQSMFAPIAESIKQCMVALHEAKEALQP